MNSKNSQVFALEAYSFESYAKCPDVPKVNANGEISTDVYDLGIYSSVEQAEKMMKLWAADRNMRAEEVFMGGFVLTERSVDAFADGAYGTVSEFESIRSYDVDGNFNCDTLCDDGCKKEFIGRDKPVKLHPGDIAVCLHNRKSWVFMVGATPYTKAEWRAKLAPSATGDVTDDCYLAFGPACHSHPMSPFVFPFPWAIPDKLQKKFDYEKFKYYGT